MQFQRTLALSGWLRARGVFCAALMAVYCLVSFPAQARSPEIAPAQSLFMERVTFGDVMGLQPGFESLVAAPKPRIKPKFDDLREELGTDMVAQEAQFMRANFEASPTLKFADFQTFAPDRSADIAEFWAIANAKPAYDIADLLTDIPDRSEARGFFEAMFVQDMARETAVIWESLVDPISTPVDSIDLKPFEKAALLAELQTPLLDRAADRRALEMLHPELFEITFADFATDTPDRSADRAFFAEALKPDALKTVDDIWMDIPDRSSDLAAFAAIMETSSEDSFVDLAMDIPDRSEDIAEFEATAARILADETLQMGPPTISFPAFEGLSAIALLPDLSDWTAPQPRLDVADFLTRTPDRSSDRLVLEDAPIQFAALDPSDFVIDIPDRDAELPVVISPKIDIAGALTYDEILPILDMIGLPGEARLLTIGDEEHATLVASVRTTSTEYEPQPIGHGGIETLRDAVEHAIATNPDVKIAEAQQEDAFYAVHEARAGFLPKVDVNAGAGPEISRQSGDENITRVRQEVNATLRQTVFDFGLTQYDYRRAKENFKSAKLETLQSVETLSYEVAVAYLGVLQQQKVVAMSEQNLEAHRNILRLVEAQKEAGQGTAADTNRVQASLANAEAFMLEEESKLQQARDQYRRLLNAPPGLLIDPLIDRTLLPLDANQAAERIESESPRLLQVKADTKSVSNQLLSHRGNYLPKVEMEVQGNIRTDVAGETGEIRDARAMLFMRYNLFNGGADTAIKKRLKARLKEAGYEFEKQRREVEQSIRNDFTAIEASRAKVEKIEEQVTAATEVVRLYQEQFRTGDRTAFDLLDAQQALINAKLEEVLNRYQQDRAAFRVLQQLGSLYYALTAAN